MGAGVRSGRLDSAFGLSQRGTSIRTEMLAGATTFLTLAYIIFVQPALLSSVGMDFGAVFTATCLASAIATLMMAAFANYPIAVAPAMGHNFYFAFTVVGAMQVPWQVALGGVAIAGALFILTAGVGLRERLITAIPDTLKRAIPVGIGLLIATVGLQWAGIVVDSPGTLVTLGDLGTPAVLVSLVGLTVMAALLVRGVRAAILIGIVVAAATAYLLGLSRFDGVVSLPPSIAPTFLQLDVLGALRPDMVAVVFVFFFLALFDSVGTLVGLGEQAGLMRDGTLPRARGALMADAAGTVVGAGLGTSTVTAFIESSTGISAGGRTGLASVMTATLFVLALFLSPLVAMIGQGHQDASGATFYPVIAPALVIVGTMMMRGVRRIAWEQAGEAIPAFLTIVMMPLAVSITEGIAFGFVSYAFLKVIAGRAGEVDALVYLFAGLFLLRYVFLV